MFFSPKNNTRTFFYTSIAIPEPKVTDSQKKIKIHALSTIVCFYICFFTHCVLCLYMHSFSKERMRPSSIAALRGRHSQTCSIVTKSLHELMHTNRSTKWRSNVVRKRVILLNECAQRIIATCNLISGSYIVHIATLT